MIKLEEHYGENVWTNTTTDPMRRNECMCLKCSNMSYDKNKNCDIAQQIYELCCDRNIAFMMTRCKEFVDKNSK